MGIILTGLLPHAFCFGKLKAKVVLIRLPHSEATAQQQLRCGFCVFLSLVGSGIMAAFGLVLPPPRRLCFRPRRVGSFVCCQQDYLQSSRWICMKLLPKVCFGVCYGQAP